MRIFTAVKHSNDPDFYYGGLWSGNFYPALRQLECEIVESKVDLLPASRFMGIAGNFTLWEKELRAEITQKIIDEVRKAHNEKPVGLFLSYFYNSHFDPAGFDEIHKLGIPTVNFYCNSICQFDLVNEIAKKTRFSWHAEKNARNLYLNTGANPVWIQMAADPEVYRPLPNLNRQPKACFVGQRYADRDRWITRLIEKNIPLEIYGPGWAKHDFKNKPHPLSCLQSAKYLRRRHPKAGSAAGYMQVIYKNIKTQGITEGLTRTRRQFLYRRKTRRLSRLFWPLSKGSVSFRQISSVFALYDIILNFSNVWQDGRPGFRLIPHVRLRDFEAPMCRTCYLTGYTEEIKEFYELGKEIDTYRTPEELSEKVKFYLAHPAEAEKLREAGYRRALGEHTWKERFKTLFDKIGIRI